MKIGIENFTDVPYTPVEISLVEANEIFEMAEEQYTKQVALIDMQENLMKMVEAVHAHGITDTLKTIYGAELTAAGIDLDNISQEGLIGAIGDFMQSVRKKLFKIQGWFEDKFKSVVDAHYAGIKYLTKFQREKGAALKSMDPEKFADTKLRVYPKSEFDSFLKATEEYIAKAPSILKKTDMTNGKEITPFLTPLGHGVNVLKSTIFGFEYPQLIQTTGFPDAKKGTAKSIGWALKDVAPMVDRVLKALDKYTYLNDIYGNAFKAYNSEAARLEKELAKGNKDAVAKGKMQLELYNLSMNFQTQVGLLQFRAVRHLSKQAIQITNKISF